MPAGAVTNSSNMTQKEFEGLSKPTQKAVLEARLQQQIIKPVLERATSQKKEAAERQAKALSGE